VPLQGVDAEGAAETTAFEFTAGTLVRLRGRTVALAAGDVRPGRRLGDDVPFNIVLKRAPTPAGPTWIYITVVVAATALTLFATLLPTALALRAQPREAAAVLA
jgi:hypothetical protein